MSAVYSCGIALLAFGAFNRPKALGVLGASPGLLLMTACLVALPFTRIRQTHLAHSLHVRRLLLIGVLGSVLSVGLFGWVPLYASKFLTLFLLAAVWMSPMLLLDVLRISHVLRGVAAALCISLFAFVVSDLLPGAVPEGMRQLIFGGGFDHYADSRARGFTDESSTFATLVARLLLIAYLIWEARRPYKGRRLILFLGGVALVLVVLGSKGAVIGIAVAILAVSAGRKQWRYLLLLLPMAWWIATTQLDAITIDIEEFSSTSTRVGMLATGLLAVLLNPLGYGYYGFYGAVNRFGNLSMDWLSERVPFIWVEMQEIVNEFVNVSTKSTLFDFAILFGWAFLWLLWKIGSQIELRDPRARAVFTYMLITSLSTSANASVLCFLCMVVLLRLYPRGATAYAAKARRQAP